MQFMVHVNISPENRDANYKRLMEKQGAVDVAGTKILGIWFAVSQLEGWTIVEAESAAALGKLLHDWTDLNVNTVVPVLSLEEFTEEFAGS